MFNYDQYDPYLSHSLISSNPCWTPWLYLIQSFTFHSAKDCEIKLNLFIFKLTFTIHHHLVCNSWIDVQKIELKPSELTESRQSIPKNLTPKDVA